MVFLRTKANKFPNLNKVHTTSFMRNFNVIPYYSLHIFFGTIYKFGSRCWKKLYQHRKEWSYNLNYLFISLHFSHCKKLLLFPSYFHFFHFSSFLRALIVAQLAPHQYFHSGHFYLLCIDCGTIIDAPCRYTGWYSI